MKIGDLFVRLGLKKDGFDKGINDAKKQTDGFASKVKGIGAKAAAVWAAVGAGVVAMAKQFINQSQTMGDGWDRTMTRLKSAWGQFLTSLTNWDWNNFWDRIKNGAQGAAEFRDAKDAEFEVGNSLKLRKAAMAEELNLLQVQMRNQQLSYDERIKAAEKYLEKLKPIYKDEAKMRANTAIKAKNSWIQEALGVDKATQAQRDQLQYFLTDIAPDTEAMKLLTEYAKHAQKGNGRVTKETEKFIDTLVNKFGYKGMGDIVEFAKYYQGTNDKKAEELVDYIEKALVAAGAFDQETRRVQNVMNSAKAASEIDTAAINTGAALEAERKKALEIVKIHEDARKTDFQLATEKYEKEKALLEQFGLDTTFLTVDYLAALGKGWQDELETMVDGLEDLETTEWQPLEIKDPDFSKLKAIITEFEKQEAKAKELAQQFNQSVAAGVSDGIQEMTDGIMGVKDINAASVFQALLTPLADMAIKEGEILVATGIGVEAIKTALGKLEGVAAVAAGAALIAVGSAAKSGLAALANSNGAAGTGSITAATASTTASAALVTNTSMQIEVTGRISGDDILLASKRAEQRQRR